MHLPHFFFTKRFLLFVLISICVLFVVYFSRNETTKNESIFAKNEAIFVKNEATFVSQKINSSATNGQSSEISELKTTTTPIKKIILDWTGFFGQPLRKENQMSACLNMNCDITNDRKFLRQSSVLIFHIADVKWNDLPKYRRSDQLYALLSHESPANTGHLDLKKAPERFFNLTLTYRRDSDVFYPYNTFVKEKSSDAPQTLESIKSVVRNKTKLVAWFVSNCQTSSRRELYVREFQKHIAVDIYGACGKLKCSDREKCRRMLHRDYKFYLAFENSNCKDYVTEKFTFLLEPGLYILPIVMWKRNYENYAPPRSFISVEDFESPKALADYLLDLDKNLDKYAEYFLYKNEYRIDSCRSVEKCGVCRLCQMALEAETAPKKRYVVENIDKWWNAPDVCDYGLIQRILKL